jgi:hypothetical protein
MRNLNAGTVILQSLISHCFINIWYFRISTHFIVIYRKSNTALTQYMKSWKQILQKLKFDYPISKTEPSPIFEPINKNCRNEFAPVLASSAHLAQPKSIEEQRAPASKTRSSITCYSKTNVFLQYERVLIMTNVNHII